MKHTRSSASGFWGAVATDLWRRRWIVGIVLLLGVVHTVFTGFSAASLGWLGLILCLSTAFLKWCWRQRASPALLGIIGALALIFLIETYLGVSTRIYGTFDPPGRQPVLLEGLMIRTLGWLYTVRPKQYIELALGAWPVVGVIYLLLHLRRRRHARGAPNRDDRTEWLELLKKFLESTSGITLVLGTLVFTNAVNLQATGLNSFAALYENESRQLGTDAAAIAELQKQLNGLKDVNDAVLREPTSRDVGLFLEATDALIDALWQTEQIEIEANQIDLARHKPNEDPLPNLTVPLPPPSRVDGGEPETNMQVLSRLSKFNNLQEQVEATQRRAGELLKNRDKELVNFAESISLALDREQRLTPEKVKILRGIVQRLAALVARDGIGRATQEIGDLVMQEQQEVNRQRQANDHRRADVTPVPANQTTARHDLLTKALLPGSESLKAFAVFITGVKNKDGDRCGGIPAGIGMVIEKYTADLEVANQDGNLHPNPGGTHYHVKLTENKAGESLLDGGFWMDIAEGLIIHPQQVAESCSASADGKRCNPPSFNIIWTDDGYPTRDNPNLRPTIYCYWPRPRIM